MAALITNRTVAWRLLPPLLILVALALAARFGSIGDLVGRSELIPIVAGAVGLSMVVFAVAMASVALVGRIRSDG